jgi:hypothetical protein
VENIWREVCGDTYTHTHTHTHTHIHTHTHTHKGTDTNRERERGTDTNTHIPTHTQTHTYQATFTGDGTNSWLEVTREKLIEILVTGEIFHCHLVQVAVERTSPQPIEWRPHPHRKLTVVHPSPRTRYCPRWHHLIHVHLREGACEAEGERTHPKTVRRLRLAAASEKEDHRNTQPLFHKTKYKSTARKTRSTGARRRTQKSPATDRSTKAHKHTHTHMHTQPQRTYTEGGGNLNAGRTERDGILATNTITNVEISNHTNGEETERDRHFAGLLAYTWSTQESENNRT